MLTLSVHFRIFCKQTITSSSFCVVMVPRIFNTFSCRNENGLSTLIALLTGKKPYSRSSRSRKTLQEFGERFEVIAVTTISRFWLLYILFETTRAGLTFEPERSEKGKGISMMFF